MDAVAVAELVPWRFVVGCGPRESQVRAVSRADTFGGCPGSWSVVPRRI
jgi:hypothetical protein